MKKNIFWIVPILFILLSINTNASNDRYFAKVSSLEEAKELAQTVDGKLTSYSEHVAVIEGTISSDIIDENGEYLLKNSSDSNGKIVSINNKDILLEKDLYCTKAAIPPYNNPYYNSTLPDVSSVNWRSAYYNNIKGKGAVVAVIDTGCAINNPEFDGQIIGTYNSVTGTSSVQDSDGHGTAVASIIASKDNDIGTIGIAPESKLYIIKSDSGNGNFYYSDIIKGLNKCIDIGYVNVVNISASGLLYSELFEDTVKDCVNHGILVVAAGGNRSSSKICYPAGFNDTLAVGSFNSATGQISDFSNYGSYIDIYAPGDAILSLNTSGGYYFLSGTSFSAPFVSGAAALIYGNSSISKNSSGANYVKNILISTKNSNSCGSLNIARIFNISESKPKAPKYIIQTQKRTGQVFVTLTSQYPIYYTTSYENIIDTGKLYTKRIRFDKSGEYDIYAVTVNGKGISSERHVSIEVPDDVISEKKLNSVELYINKIKKSGKYNVKRNKTYTIKVENKGKNIKPDKFKWSVNDTKLATINNKGVIKIKSSAKKGSTITVKAKLGDVTKKITLIVKK